MPWRNQKDGEGGKKDGGQSPWGGRPSDEDSHKSPLGSKRPGGRGEPAMPDIDALLRKGQNGMKHLGGGFIAGLIIVLAVIFWLFHCFYIVQQNEQAVELRFGVPRRAAAEEGLHFYLWPIETYRKVPRTEQTVTIGGADGEGLMLSGDQNIVNVNFSVYYYITDPAAYLFNVRDQSGTIAQVAESAMREIVGRRPADDVYRNRREIVANEVRGIIQSTLNKYGMGVEVGRVSIREAAPPAEVAEAFNSVQQAEQERNRLIEQGNQERARLRGLANGRASVIRAEAAAYKARITEEARGEAQRFTSVEKEAKTAPEATRFRLYIEAMEQILSAPNKIIMENSAGAVPYLPLDKLLNSGRAGGKNTAPQGRQADAPRTEPAGESAVAGGKSPRLTNHSDIVNPRGGHYSAHSGQVR